MGDNTTLVFATIGATAIVFVVMRVVFILINGVYDLLDSVAKLRYDVAELKLERHNHDRTK